MKSVRMYDFILFDAQAWQVVGVDGSRAALKSQASGRIRHVALTELLADDSFQPETADRLPVLDDVRFLESVPQQVAEDARWLQRHIVEIIRGVPPIDDTPQETIPNPAYADDVPRYRRIEAKVAELASTARPLRERQLRQYVKAYERDGVAALVDRRKLRDKRPGLRQDPRIMTLLHAYVVDQTETSTGTRKRALDHVKYQARLEGITVPSDATLYRLLSQVEGDLHPFGNATTRRTRANRPNQPFSRRRATLPGQLVEIDSTPLDLAIVYPDGSTGRPELSAMIDVATGTICGAILVPEGTKGVELGTQLLARSLTPLPMQPGWDDALSLARSTLPAEMMVPDPELRAGIAARPLIYPETITIDRGKNYMSEVFRNACERLEIGLTLASPGTPTDKPHIERFMRAVEEQFTQYLDGYTGRDVVNRGRDVERRARWALHEVQSLLDQWLVTVWQNQPKDRLRHPAVPKRALTPNQMYTALSGIAPTATRALTRDDYISMLPMKMRTVQHSGINLDAMSYNSPALNPYRKQPSGLSNTDKWEVRYDPSRMNVIFLRDHRKPSVEQWIEVPWILHSDAVPAFSESVAKVAVRLAKEASRGQEAPSNLVLDHIMRIQSGLNLSTATERKASRRNSQPNVPELALAPEARTPVPRNGDASAPTPEAEPDAEEQTKQRKRVRRAEY